jgi:hypothetical protein
MNLRHISAIEYLADHVETGDQIGPNIYDEQTHRLADVDLLASEDAEPPISGY